MRENEGSLHQADAIRAAFRDSKNMSAVRKAVRAALRGARPAVVQAVLDVFFSSFLFKESLKEILDGCIIAWHFAVRNLLELRLRLIIPFRTWHKHELYRWCCKETEYTLYWPPNKDPYMI